MFDVNSIRPIRCRKLYVQLRKTDSIFLTCMKFVTKSEKEIYINSGNIAPSLSTVKSRRFESFLSYKVVITHTCLGPKM